MPEHNKNENQLTTVFKALRKQLIPEIGENETESTPSSRIEDKVFYYANKSVFQLLLNLVNNNKKINVHVTTTQINFSFCLLSLLVSTALICSLAGAPIGIPMLINSIISLGEIAAGFIASFMMFPGMNTVFAATKLAARTVKFHHTTQKNELPQHQLIDKTTFISPTIKIAIGVTMIGVGIAACSTGIGAIGGIPLLIAGMMMASGMVLTIPSLFTVRYTLFASATSRPITNYLDEDVPEAFQNRRTSSARRSSQEYSNVSESPTTADDCDENNQPSLQLS